MLTIIEYIQNFVCDVLLYYSLLASTMYNAALHESIHILCNDSG